MVSSTGVTLRAVGSDGLMAKGKEQMRMGEEWQSLKLSGKVLQRGGLGGKGGNFLELPKLGGPLGGVNQTNSGAEYLLSNTRFCAST